MATDNPDGNHKKPVNRERLLRLALQNKGLIGTKSEPRDAFPRRSQVTPMLSSAQQRLWFLEQLSAGSAAYVFSNKLELAGSIDLDCLRRAFQSIVDRHEIMRTQYRQDGGVPYQVIVENLQLDIPFVDLSERDEFSRNREYETIECSESTRPFDLENAPLVRICIVRFDANHHIVLLTLHHIVYDGWSLAVMFNELKLIYEAYVDQKPDPLPPLDIQYTDFSYWQRQRLKSDDMCRQVEYWKQALGGQLPILELNNDLPRPDTQSYNGELYRFELSSSLSESLRVFAFQRECTLSMLMLTAFKILLHRYTGETDIIVGMPIANRNHHQIEKLIGFFVNTLAVRSSLEFDPSVEELLTRIRCSSSEAYVNQDLPFDQVVDEVQPQRDLGHNPIFQVMFAFQNTPALPASIGQAQINLEGLDNGTSVFDLTLNIHDGENKIDGYFEYCTDLFHRDTIERMRGHYQTILEAMVANPRCKISRIQMLTPRESRQLLDEWNDTTADYEINGCIHHLFEKQARQNPDRVAIHYIGQSLSYAELNRKSNQLAHYLQSRGVKPDTIVAVYMERSCDMLVAILAVLKAGGAYLPIDPSYPSERITFVLDDSGTDFMLTHEHLLENLPESKIELICIDREAPDLLREKITNPDSRVGPNNLVYIIYTSGSTGLPKGVMVDHCNLVHSTLARINYYFDQLQSFLLLSSFAFDSSVAGIFWTLCQGGVLHLPLQDAERDPQQIANLVQAAGVTHMLTLPSVHSLLLNMAEPDQLQSLKAIIVAGEACPPELVAEHRSVIPNTGLYNEYGPTEGTVWSTVYEFPEDEIPSPVPIGKPFPNVKTYILDKNLQPVPIGIVGELYIGGAGITRGYLNREELTAQRYLKSPFGGAVGYDRLYKTGDLVKHRADANILFCGRLDHQVKIRGYRIELGEIESVLQRHESVKDVVVIAMENSTEDFNIDILIANLDPSDYGAINDIVSEVETQGE